MQKKAKQGEGMNGEAMVDKGHAKQGDGNTQIRITSAGKKQHEVRMVVGSGTGIHSSEAKLYD